jgi:hypothetical protein
MGSSDTRAANNQPQFYRPWDEREFKQSATIWLTPANWILAPSLYAWLDTFRSYWFGGDLSWWPVRQEATLDDGRKYYRLSTSATTRWPWILVGKLANDFELQNLLELNGTAKVSLNSEIFWSNRFITMTAWARPQETSWYHDINMPAVWTNISVSNGTTVTVVSNTAWQTGLSGWIPLWVRQTLRYRIPKWSGAWIVAANFRIQNYGDSSTWANGIMWPTISPTQDASEWILICSRDDNNSFKRWTGDTCSLWAQFGQWMDIQETVSRQSDKNRYLVNGYTFRPRSLTNSTVSFWFSWYIRSISMWWNNWYSNVSGYRDINTPAIGTVIYWVWWLANTVRRATTANDAMNRMWEAYLWEWPNASTPVVDLNTYNVLRFAHDVNGWVNAWTWYLTNYGNNFVAPPHWIFVAQRDETWLISTFSWDRLNRGEYLRNAKRESLLSKSRYTITSKGTFDCRFTQANFFSGTAANGLGTSSSTSGALISRPDNTLMAAMDSDQWRPYTWIQLPSAGYAIPMLDATGTRTRVVQTIWGRRFVPICSRETLIYIPQQNTASSSTVDRGWFMVNYGDSRHIPANALTIASWSADGALAWANANKTRIKMWDGTYIQPWQTLASATPVSFDQAHGTTVDDWRDIVVAWQTWPWMTSAMAAVIGITWPYWAPYNPQFRLICNQASARWNVELRWLLALNSNVIANSPVIAFLPWATVQGNPIVMAQATSLWLQDNQPVPVQLRLANATVSGSTGVSITAFSNSLNTSINPYFTLWTNGNLKLAWALAWLSFDNIILPAG